MLQGPFPELSLHVHALMKHTDHFHLAIAFRHTKEDHV